MALKVQKVDVWAGALQDQPGGLARALSGVANAGGSVDCVIARRDPSRPGMGELFITPVRGAKVQSAARDAGMSPADNLVTLRIEGSDTPGLGARMTEALAAAGINLRGVTTAVIGRNFVTYVGLDNPADADRAMTTLRSVKSSGGGGGGKKRSTAKRAGGSKKKSAAKKRR
jgi:predicted amino acid-binding ACT domain protein